MSYIEQNPPSGLGGLALGYERLTSDVAGMRSVSFGIGANFFLDLKDGQGNYPPDGILINYSYLNGGVTVSKQLVYDHSITQQDTLPTGVLISVSTPAMSGYKASTTSVTIPGGGIGIARLRLNPVLMPLYFRRR